VLLSFVLFQTLVAEFLNGWTDAPNCIGTILATKVLSKSWALVLAIVGNVAGVYLLGQVVAKTIGNDMLDNRVINLQVLSAALLSGIIWASFAAWMRFGISKSHTLFGGLGGAAYAYAGWHALHADGWIKIGIGIAVSLCLGSLVTLILLLILQKLMTRPNRDARGWRYLQVATASFVALAHGSNDGQKYIGVFTQALVVGGVLHTFTIPAWVIALCTVVMGLGTACGGWGIVRRVEEDFGVDQPYQGAVIESVTAGLLITSSRFGIPQSTTHTMLSATLGAGAVSEDRKLNRKVVGQLFTIWVLTLPACAAMAWLIMQLILKF
jgi:PiT family inorganic phosphate transporter